MASNTSETSPPLSPSEEQNTSCEEQKETLSIQIKASDQMDAEISGPRPGLNVCQINISVAPSKPISGSASPVKSGCGCTPTTTPSRNADIETRDLLAKPFKQLQDIVDAREMYFKDELSKKEAEFETKMKAKDELLLKKENQLRIIRQQFSHMMEEHNKTLSELEKNKKTLSELVAQKDDLKKDLRKN